QYLPAGDRGQSRLWSFLNYSRFASRRGIAAIFTQKSGVAQKQRSRIEYIGAAQRSRATLARKDASV
ncbi:MAG: hypothetical protein ACXWU5_05840, partial [Rhodoplanes sp.]